jgi:hypothetical protein
VDFAGLELEVNVVQDSCGVGFPDRAEDEQGLTARVRP